MLKAQGGRPPYSWKLVTGTLPAGLHLSGAGVLAGVPAVPGISTLGVAVTDSSRPLPLMVDTEITLGITPAPLRIRTKDLPGGATGSLYNVTLVATGGVVPYSWKWLTGQLPPGLSLSANGVLSGTPTGGGTYKFSVQLTDSGTSPQAATARFSVTIVTTPLVIRTKSLSRATVGSSFSTNLVATGGVPPYTWGLHSGVLPTGVTLSAAGELGGTPTIPGTYPFAVKVTDSSSTPRTVFASYKLVVVPVPLSITTKSLPGGTVGSAYTATLAATGGTAPYTWAVASGTLPAGIALNVDGNLSGVPAQPGSFSLSVKVTDSSPSPMSTVRAYSLTVTPVPLLVSTTGLPAVAVDSPYAAVLTASGGTAPYTWTESGALPPGIVLSSAGNLTGETNTAGAYEFTVQVVDSSPNRETASAVLTLVVGSSAADWSGYVLDGNYTSVNGTFTVPSTFSYAQDHLTPAAVTQWVGLDGVTGPSPIQAGVTEMFGPSASVACPPSTSSMSTPICAWWGVPSSAGVPVVTPIEMTISAGDKITVTIFRIGGNAWAVTFDDDTSSQEFRAQTSYNGPGTTADFVLEAPSSPYIVAVPTGSSSGTGTTTTTVAGSTAKVYPLAAFSPPVDFTDLETEGTTSASAALVLVMNGVQVATPSVYTSTGFAVAYGSVAPAAP
jgi:hypothetical protein